MDVTMTLSQANFLLELLEEYFEALEDGVSVEPDALDLSYNLKNKIANPHEIKNNLSFNAVDLLCALKTVRAQRLVYGSPLYRMVTEIIERAEG